MVQDKEQLYEEVTLLKKAVNALRQENTRMRTQARQAENELTKNDKLVKDLTAKLNRQNYMSYGTSGGSAPKSDTHLILSLKKQNKEVRRENRELREEIEALHKDIKLTTMNEIEVEARTYAEECIRLRKLLNNITSSPKLEEPEEGINARQEELIATVKRENAELGDTLKKREEVVAEYREKLRELHEKTDKLAKEREAEIGSLKQALDEEKGKLVQSEARRNEEMRQKLIAKASEKEDAIRAMEKKLGDVVSAKDLEIKQLKEERQAQKRTSSLASDLISACR